MKNKLTKFNGYLVINEQNQLLTLDKDGQIWLFKTKQHANEYIKKRESIDKKFGKTRIVVESLLTY